MIRGRRGEGFLVRQSFETPAGPWGSLVRARGPYGLPARKKSYQLGVLATPVQIRTDPYPRVSVKYFHDGSRRSDSKWNGTITELCPERKIVITSRAKPSGTIVDRGY